MINAMTWKAAARSGGFAALLMAAAPGPAAASIVYTVDQTIGAGGVTGTITTDGVVGLLSASDFTAWDLLLTGAGGVTYTLTNGSSGVEVGNISDPFNPTAGNADVTADTKHIYFNYDGTDGGYLGFQVNFYSGDNYWCNASYGNDFDCSQGKAVVPEAYYESSSQHIFATGDQIIATTGVPEPSTWAMIVLGFAGVGFAGYRQRRAAFGRDDRQPAT